MKVSINEFKDIVQDAIQNGFFEEVTEDILNDDSEFEDCVDYSI